MNEGGGRFRILTLSHAFDGPDLHGTKRIGVIVPLLTNHQIGEQTSERWSNWQGASAYSCGHLPFSGAPDAALCRCECGSHS
jgi:hypothetical protein